jgi:hypothetical protein
VKLTLKKEDSHVLARNEVESRLDQLFENAETCHKVRDLAVWHLLTTFEDFCRFNFAGDTNCDLKDIPYAIDKEKYALKHSLDVITRDSIRSKVSLTQKLNGESYTKSFELLKFGSSYQKLYRAIASSFNDRAKFEKIDNRYEITITPESNPAYTVLEVIAHGQKPIFDFIVLAYILMRNEDEEYKNIRSELLKRSNARTKKRLVVYNYDHDYANYISSKVQQRPTVVPDNYKFPWGGGRDTQMLINSVSIRCLYHLLVVHLLGNKNNIMGGNWQSLVMKTTKSQLIEDISVFTGNISNVNIEKFIDFLIYGRGVNNPDPALQPFFLTMSNEILIPCSLVISNNMQRNVLSLYARIDSSEFDRQSHAFEKEMISEADSWIRCLSYSLVNEIIVIGKNKEEIDVLLVDSESKFILVLEFRWFLQPGDIREVQQRISTCYQKVTQTERKLKFVKENHKAIIEQYFPEVDSSGSWDINGSVVIKGFGGQESPNKEVPVITLDVLNVGAEKLRNLKELYNWIESKVWLPEKSLHFESVDDEVDLDGIFVSIPSIEVKVTPTEYKDYVQSTI